MRKDILEQAQAIRASMDAAAIVLTDEQAAKAPRLYPTWAAGLAVKAGDRLYYPGTERTASCTCASEPARRRAVRWFFNIFRMNWWATTLWR